MTATIDLSEIFYLCSIGDGPKPNTEEYAFTAHDYDKAKKIFFELRSEDIDEFIEKNCEKGKYKACGFGMSVLLNIKTNKILSTEFTVEVEDKDEFIDFIDVDAQINEDLIYKLIESETENE